MRGADYLRTRQKVASAPALYRLAAAWMLRLLAPDGRPALPETLPFGDTVIKPLRAGETLAWSLRA